MTGSASIRRLEPNDQGPIYRETDMSRLPVEPWSTASNLVFLLVFVYFAVKTKFNYNKFPLLVIFLIILFVGWVGGTIYHATRSHDIWLKLDYMPIMFLVLMATIYFWRELVRKWILVFIFTMLPIMIYYFIYETLTFSHTVSVSIGYSVMAVVVVVPLILHCVYKNPKAWKSVTAALISFAIAITFRLLDKQFAESITMGTHFLWHIFGGFCCFFILHYIYKTEKMRIT
ncbi:MAG: ceramidase domain-containing protein [Victivallales bacterium]|nr:ceramidase domain-containing protein [Victivallales bacterium]